MDLSLFNLVDILLYFLPIGLIFIFGRSINRHFRNRQTKIKLVDLMIPYLMVGIQILSIRTFKQSIFLYFLIFLFSLGIIIAILIAYKKGEISYSKFFKTYWRFVFLFSFLMYYFLVAASIVNKLVSF
ncbi:DUF3397 domain-containing protein [Carnobacterium sp. TMP28]|uniref:DUF3397 domain-containing protein n=1 Tax=Carnobacterium sp. TMP28 TaxID=3397060 RepID=UPI0039E0F78A